MENEELSPASDGGAGVTTEQQGAETNSQESSQSQTSESAPVDSGESQASSQSPQTRKNYDWANQRLLEKTVKKVLSSALEERLAPLMERLNPPPQPSAVPSKDEIDFNDLPGSIKGLVNKLLEQERAKINPSKLKEEILGDIQTKTTRQEARKYLTSQQDIGNDAARHQEIQEIIANDKLLYHSVSDYPVEVMQEAIKRWRSGKTNPNAPSKAELGTVTGGMGAVQRKSDPTQKIRELSEKLISPTLSIEEREKYGREFDSLVSSLK